jgi:hypothetical protein
VYGYEGDKKGFTGLGDECGVDVLVRRDAMM